MGTASLAYARCTGEVGGVVLKSVAVERCSFVGAQCCGGVVLETYSKGEMWHLEVPAKTETTVGTLSFVKGLRK